MNWWYARGHAKVNVHDTQAFGTCDSCGFTYNLNDLKWQFEWAGAQLINLHLRHCPTCLWLPNEQNRSIVLPPDPVPIANPRPEPPSELTSGDFDYDFNNDFYNQ